MKLSKSTHYALHTMLHLTISHAEGHTSVSKLAGHQQVSTTYLSKILTKLVKAGLIVSVPGANGGYKLKANWQETTLLDVIQAVEGLPPIFDYCEDHNPSCIIQQSIQKAEKNFLEELGTMKIADLAEDARNVPHH
ncbi:Rrf2 family transcriptional regulator [Geomicrobium sp. JCM 19038]|uniref:RrF2 family transcriptional regulator n=1 Tax=Geomicrobium sp. JCM 19038 TaxID=1460635 RepID=UPI00045F2E9F|nr:Rrf2 family transcriptional regulator [Geomicrobium sp. JCM 19038]GAK08242.1 Rrf2 family transcriptional regulator [Geomicrobium sp. JCM 19038]